jgi:hypothetical protein
MKDERRVSLLLSSFILHPSGRSIVALVAEIVEDAEQDEQDEDAAAQNKPKVFSHPIEHGFLQTTTGQNVLLRV